MSQCVLEYPINDELSIAIRQLLRPEFFLKFID